MIRKVAFNDGGGGSKKKNTNTQATGKTDVKKTAKIREQRIYQLQEKIKSSENYLNQLKEKEKQYNDMIAKIAEAEEYIKNAQNNITDCNSNLSVCLKGNKGKIASNKVEDVIEVIHKIQPDLITISDAANSNIAELKKQITTEEDYIRKLRIELGNL